MNDAGTWTVDVVVQNDSCLRTVSAQFQFAPPRLGFSAYTVMLVHGNDPWLRVVQNKQKLLLVNEVRRFVHRFQ